MPSPKRVQVCWLLLTLGPTVAWFWMHKTADINVTPWENTTESWSQCLSSSDPLYGGDSPIIGVEGWMHAAGTDGLACESDAFGTYAMKIYLIIRDFYIIVILGLTYLLKFQIN